MKIYLHSVFTNYANPELALGLDQDFIFEDTETVSYTCNDCAKAHAIRCGYEYLADNRSYYKLGKCYCGTLRIFKDEVQKDSKNKLGELLLSCLRNDCYFGCSFNNMFEDIISSGAYLKATDAVYIPDYLHSVKGYKEGVQKSYRDALQGPLNFVCNTILRKKSLSHRAAKEYRELALRSLRQDIYACTKQVAAKAAHEVICDFFKADQVIKLKKSSVLAKKFLACTTLDDLRAVVAGKTYDEIKTLSHELGPITTFYGNIDFIRASYMYPFMYSWHAPKLKCPHANYGECCFLKSDLANRKRLRIYNFYCACSGSRYGKSLFNFDTGVLATECPYKQYLQRYDFKYKVIAAVIKCIAGQDTEVLSSIKSEVDYYRKTEELLCKTK